MTALVTRDTILRALQRVVLPNSPSPALLNMDLLVDKGRFFHSGLQFSQISSRKYKFSTI